MSTVELADMARELVEHLERAAHELTVERLAAATADEQFSQVERARLDVLRALREARAIVDELASSYLDSR
jgi:hypothetical protein